MYLCYDIRGIQSFIFQIPRLKYIIGGSALVDRFDREIVPDLAKQNGWKLISAGGGKGAFECQESDADTIEKALMREVHGFGADIRFGRSKDDYSQAAHCAERLYPFLPKELDGHPCPESGLYPVADNAIHPVVNKRNYSDGDVLSRWFEERLLTDANKPRLPRLLCEEGTKLSFMRDVEEHTPGCRALGNRNRWAVICMDGNDMGNQFRKMMDLKLNQDQKIEWIKAVGNAIDQCSVSACLAGINAVLEKWAAEDDVRASIINTKELLDKDGSMVIPLRPLVVGGDDISILCHVAYAADFVRAACEAFAEKSKELAVDVDKKQKLNLWPATGGSITISASILFCGTSLPLASAIPYAETLLAIAKKKGRVLSKEGSPSPACVEFESITESMLDHPMTRRSRELFFEDKDIDQRVELTNRPYLLEDFVKLQKQARSLKLPGSIQHQILPGLSSGFDDRRVFYARLAKNYPELAKCLNETKEDNQPEGSHWQVETIEREGKNKKIRRTDIPDMLLLVQEAKRISQETIHENSEN